MLIQLVARPAAHSPPTHDPAPALINALNSWSYRRIIGKVWACSREWNGTGGGVSQSVVASGAEECSRSAEHEKCVGTMSVGVDASIMPNLDAFDEEFGRERSDIVADPPRNTGFRISTLIGLALAAGVISALALGWPNTSGPSRSELQSEPASAPNSGEKSEKLDAAVNRL